VVIRKDHLSTGEAMPVWSLAAAADDTRGRWQRRATSCFDNAILRREGVEAGFVTGRNCRLK
jgi:hypothetical protein